MEDSERYIKAPVQDVVDEWMVARNGTVKASGDDPYYYDEKKVVAVDSSSKDMRYDLPGEVCTAGKEGYSAYAALHISTKIIDPAKVDADAEINRVAEFWKSQGWSDVQQGAEAQGEHRIMVTTSLGTQITYALIDGDGRPMRILKMRSLCAAEFDNLSPQYLGDFEERFSSPPNTTPSAASSKGN